MQVVRSIFLSLVLFGVLFSTTAVVGAEKKDGKAEVKVRKGDTLSGIAGKHLWRILWEVNKDSIKDPDLIYPGDLVIVPDAFGPAKPPTEDFVDPRYVKEFVDVLYTSNGAVVTYLSPQGDEVDIAPGTRLASGGQIEIKSGVAVIRVTGEYVAKLVAGSLLTLRGRVERYGESSVIELLSGSMEMIRTKDDANKIIVYSPEGIAEFEGEHTYFEIVPEYSTKISAYKGTIRFLTQESAQKVVTGQGYYIPSKSGEAFLVAIPNAPMPMKPGGRVGNQVKFEWGAVRGIDHYKLHFGRNKDLYSVDFSGDIYVRNEFSVTLNNQGEYFWSIRSVDNLGFMSRPHPPVNFSVHP